MPPKPKHEMPIASTVAKVALSAVMVAVGILLAMQTNDPIVYSWDCQLIQNKIVCSKLTAGALIISSGLGILLWTIAKGLLYGLINLVRSIRGKDVVKGE